MVESYRAEPGSKYLLKLTTGEEIPVSRTRFKELKARMG
jgi:DNA-binding LytR/AlgR family response regulator